MLIVCVSEAPIINDKLYDFQYQFLNTFGFTQIINMK